MTEAQYERIIKAALSMKRSKYDMAEALVLDIPHASAGDGDGSVTSALEEVAAKIVDEGGDEISVRKLRDWRMTAAWVQDTNNSTPTFRWREGSSFTAHYYAAQASMDYDEFASRPRLARDVQALLGNKVTSTSVKHTVENMTQVEKVDMMRALASDDINSVTDVVVEQQKEAVIKAAEKVKNTAEPAFKEPSTSTMQTKRLDDLKDVMSRNVAFTKLIVQRWQREVEDLGGFVKAEDNRVMAGYLDGAVQEYTVFIDELEASV